MEFQLIVRILAKISFRNLGIINCRAARQFVEDWALRGGGGKGEVSLFPVIATGKKYRFKCKCMQDNPEID